MVAKTDSAREEAACVFLRWLTQPAQNMRFIAQTGYLPVTRQAFEQDLSAAPETLSDPRIQKMLTAVLAMYKDYAFFTAPGYSAFDALSRDYEADFKSLLARQREEYAAGRDLSWQEALSLLGQ